MRIHLLLLIFVFFFSCSHEKNPLTKALESDKVNIRRVMDKVGQHEVQIKLTTIDRVEGEVKMEDFEFRLDEDNYFYPASTVKFLLSVLVLEALSEDELLTIDTPFKVEGDSVAVTFRQQIRDIFAVSSNDTYNRLFEFYGKDKIEARMKTLGVNPIRISHRLSTENAYDLKTKSTSFYKGDSVFYKKESVMNEEIQKLELEGIKKGKGYYADGKLVEEPFDFSERNYLPISTLHGLMKRVMFPEKFEEEERFKLSEENRRFLIESMKLYPKDEGYSLPEYYDSYGKFFLFGDNKEKIPEHFEMYNKVGYAYGYLTDCAYVVDKKAGIEFILTACIHVNENGIFNDDVYEYEEVGIPFLAELGREILHQISAQ